MRRAIFFSTAALVACRGIIGVEDLELADGGGGGTDGAIDTGKADTSIADAATEQSPVKKCIEPGQDCRKCCREGFGAQIVEWAKLAKTTGCACLSDGGGCTVECSTPDTCPPGGGPAQTCGKCIDDLLITGLNTKQNPCEKAANDCRNAANCMLAVECLDQCN